MDTIVIIVCVMLKERVGGYSWHVLCGQCGQDPIPVHPNLPLSLSVATTNLRFRKISLITGTNKNHIEKTLKSIFMTFFQKHKHVS